MITIREPAPDVLQVSGFDPEARPILSVLVKRTYQILPDGRANPASEQLPLRLDIENDEDNPRRFHRDTDAYPFKVRTDVVVHGAVEGRGRPSTTASVRVGNTLKAIAVFGDRKVALTGTGRLLFSDPEPIEKIPLRYDRAYGGIDQAAHDRHGNPVEALNKYMNPPFDPFLASPYLYPRNHVGVGYLVEATAAAVDRLVLPNLEDPADLLSPDRLVVGASGRWPLMPIPQSFDWVDMGTFPRLAYAGVVHDHEPLRAPVAEVARGFAPANLLDEKPLEQQIDARFTSGASLGLQVPYLMGGETCQLENIHPRQQVWSFRVPAERPEIKVDGRNGTLKDTSPVIHTLEIDAEKSLVSVLWRGSAAALRPYGDEELKTMPLLVRWA